jgi:hypothetical protein
MKEEENTGTLENRTPSHTFYFIVVHRSGLKRRDSTISKEVPCMSVDIYCTALYPGHIILYRWLDKVVVMVYSTVYCTYKYYLSCIYCYVKCVTMACGCPL